MTPPGTTLYTFSAHQSPLPETGRHLEHDIADCVGCPCRRRCLLLLAAEDLQVEDGQVHQAALAQLAQDAGTKWMPVTVVQYYLHLCKALSHDGPGAPI